MPSRLFSSPRRQRGDSWRSSGNSFNAFSAFLLAATFAVKAVQQLTGNSFNAFSAFLLAATPE